MPIIKLYTLQKRNPALGVFRRSAESPETYSVERMSELAIARRERELEND